MADKHQGDPQERAKLIKALREQHMPDQTAIWERDITHEEFYHLLSRYPYLELHNVDKPKPLINDTAQLHKARSGWIIHDHNDVICASSTELPISEVRRLYNTLLGETTATAKSAASAADSDDDEDGGEGGRGTLQAQMITTAYEMVQMAYNRWKNVAIIGGFYGMKRAAWVAAMRFGKQLTGFEPTSEDKVVLYWANKLTPNVGMEFKPALKP